MERQEHATYWDRFATCWDRTASGGVLVAQDDFADAHTPYDSLVAAADKLELVVHDKRQFPRPKGSRGCAHGTRKLKKVTALWWHQMACALDSPDRCTKIPVHGAVLAHADIVLLHPIRAYMWHGGPANRFSIGIEIAVREAGIRGNPSTFWRSKAERKRGTPMGGLERRLSDKQRLAGRLLGEYYIAEHARQCALTAPGARLTAQGFHRGSSASRTSDPGSAIALGIVRPLCRTHGHAYGGQVRLAGNPTPEAWGGGAGVPYSKSVPGTVK